MGFKGSLCFRFDNFLKSCQCLLKQHSLSNHFLFEDDLMRLCFLVILIFRHCLAVVLRIFSTFSRDALTS